MIELVASVCQIPGHVQVGLGESMQITESQHPWQKTREVVHGRSEILSIFAIENPWEGQVAWTRVLDKLG